MNIFIKSVKFKNILSYGNALVEFPINDGLTAIIGSNGNGKSVLLDAISFGMFGKPYRDIKLSELINRKNKKDMIVEIKFVVNVDTEYVIRRGLAPTFLDIQRNGQSLELLSSKKLTQDELDKIIGMSYKLFRQIISLSINKTEPFLTLTAQAKRELIEQIFNVKIFGEMLKLVKKDVSDAKISLQMNERVLDVTRANVESLTRHVSELDGLVGKFNIERDTALGKYEAALKKTKADLKLLKSKQTDIQAEIDEIIYVDPKSILVIRDELKSQMIVAKNTISVAEKIIKHLNENSICPMCRHDLDVDHKQTEIVIQTEIISEATTKLNESKLKLDEVEISRETNEKVIERHRQLTAFLEKTKIDVSQLVKFGKDCIANIDEWKAKTFSADVDTPRTELIKKQEELVVLNTGIADVKDSLVENEIMAEILADSGIKSYIFKRIVPVLNKHINEYLAYFDLGVTVTFDEMMDETIKVIGYHGSEVAYSSFSEGEKKRIDMAILLSFIKISKVLAEWNCNLLVVDELLDSSIDDAGLAKLLGSLKNISANKDHQSTLIISHRLQHEFGEFFENVVEIKKAPNGFSDLHVKRGL